YAALRRHWSGLVNSERKHTLTAAHHLLYLALRGKDWRRAFAPISNPRKLANGALYDWGLVHALDGLHSQVAEEALLAPFAGLVTPAMLQQVRAWVPRLWVWHYPPESYAPGVFPFDAYT